jgi:hypothetical protein
MSYHVTVNNRYREAVKAFRTIVNQNQQMKINETLGNGYIEVFGVGTINFNDIGQDHLGGYSKSTWGVLISYQGEEIVFRYEGGGEINVTINKYGQAELGGNGEFSRVPLGSFILESEKTPPQPIIVDNEKVKPRDRP